MKNKEVENHQMKMQKDLNKLLSKDGLMIDDYKIVAIGYLSSDEEFEKGEVSSSFLTKLKILWNEGMTLGSMGHHTCEFCNKATSSSEKTLIDHENKIKYIFNEMIFHYIKCHNFRPPSKFIEFIMRQ